MIAPSADPDYDHAARDFESSLLRTTLDLLVPVQILELQAWGGPTPADLARVQARLQEITEQADVLLAGGGKRGEAAKVATWLAESIAILAFQPGGYTNFGRQWTTPIGPFNTEGDPVNTLEQTSMIETLTPDLVPPAEAPPAPTWWVHAKGTPMTRHAAHKTRPTKTACGLSQSRMRVAAPDEVARLGVCSFCEPAAKSRKKKARR